jgi:hypothetical protein
MLFDVHVTYNYYQCLLAVLRIRDLGSGTFLTPGSGMNKNQDPDPGSGINNPDHISESLETTVWVKNTKNSLLWIFLTLDPGSGTGVEKFKPVIISRILNIAFWR